MTVQERLEPARPPAAEDPEAALWRELRRGGSPAAREKLFMAHLPFANKLARRHFMDRLTGDIEFQDLYQLACTGLLEAIDRFDPGLGVPFRGYAARRVSGSVLDGIARMSEVREQIAFRNRVRRDRLRSLAPDSIDEASIAAALHALVDAAVGLALGFMLEGTSLYRGEGEAERRPNAYESAAWKATVRRMLEELDSLPEREQAVLRHHYLTGMRFDQVAALLGLSKGRISQLHKSGVALLRKRMARAGEYKLQP